MPTFTHKWENNGVVVTFSWLGDAQVKPDRVYAFAFTSDGKMLLVTDSQWAPMGWLPGGGIKNDETPQQALVRELREEANAVLVKSVKIGVQRAAHSSGEQSYHAFYWCRVILEDDFVPKYEISERYLVTPDEFLDRLFWGRKDPKAPMMFDRALEIEQNNENGAEW